MFPLSKSILHKNDENKLCQVDVGNANKLDTNTRKTLFYSARTFNGFDSTVNRTATLKVCEILALNRN